MTAKIAKKWFRENPRCVVTFHRRWNELSQASREVLMSPRTVKLQGNRAVFEEGRSECSLVRVTGWIDDRGQLTLSNEAGEHFITYAPAP